MHRLFLVALFQSTDKIRDPLDFLYRIEPE
jgi:hypothetical protein